MSTNQTPQTLSELLKNSAQKQGSKTALVFGQSSISYSQLWQKSLALACSFKRNGIQAGSKVALLHKNSPEYILAVFALSHLGACAVPINFFQKEEEVLYICINSGAQAIVAQQSFAKTAQFAKHHCPSIEHVWYTDDKNFDYLLEKKEDFPIAQDSQKTILILYTSGTTGHPKGVMLSHQNLCSNAASAIAALGLCPRDRFMCILPMFHVFAWTTNVVIPLQLGCPIVIVESVRPPRPWLKMLAQHKITIFAAVPQIYALLAAQAQGFKKWILRFYFFRTVRMAISGAAPLSGQTLDQFQDRFNVPLLEGYGLTETSPVTHVNTLTAHKKNSVGQPLPGVQHKIIDADENVLPINAEGEICVRGNNVMQGYFQMPQETQAAFTQDGWLKTGDVGLIDDQNFLFIKDRIKDMIIVKGLKVFSIQIEQILLSHPSVAECAVVGAPDPDGDEQIRAFIVLKENFAADKTALQKLCQEKLPPYKRPKDITFLKELPKNALQKVLKRQLRQHTAS